MAAVKVHRVDFAASDWLGGTGMLSLEERFGRASSTARPPASYARTASPLVRRRSQARPVMDDVVLARALHVLAVVIWVGGVAMATMVVLPAVRRGDVGANRLEVFEAIERRFAWYARIATATRTSPDRHPIEHVIDLGGQLELSRNVDGRMLLRASKRASKTTSTLQSL